MSGTRSLLCKSHPDFHLPADVEVGRGFDGRAYARQLKASGADAVVFFAKCHYGHSYYPTKVGTVHPGLRMDMLRAAVEGCHAEGIALVCYYSVFLDTAAVRGHPDWGLQTTRARADAGLENANFLPLCVNSGYPDELLIPQALEVVRDYDVDEMFFDTMTGFQPCYCDRCRALFGAEIPQAGDEQWLRYVRWYYEQYEEFFAKVAAAVHAVRPGLPVTFNWKWSYKQPGPPVPHIGRIAADLFPTGVVAHFVTRYGAGTGYPFDYMCGRFLHGLGDWNSTTVETLKYTAAVTVANGGSFYVIDRQLPDGSLEPRAYAAMRDVFGWLQQRREIVAGTTHVAETAALYSFDHVVGPDLRFFPDEAARDARLRPFTGFARMYMEHARHYTAVSTGTLARRLADYRLVVLPEAEFLDAATKRALLGFVESGGRLLIVQPGSAAAVDPDILDLAGVTYEGHTELDYGYIDYTRGGMPDPILTRGAYAKVRPRDGASMIHAYIPPMAAGRGGHKFGHGFAPPTAPDGHAAAVARQLGAGTVVYVAAPVLTSYETYQNPFLAEMMFGLIDRLLPDPLVRVHTPAQVEMVAVRKGDDLIVHLVNHSGKERLGGYWAPVTEYIPEIRDVRVEVRAPHWPAAITLEPEGTPIRGATQGAYVAVTVPSLHIMQSIRLRGYFNALTRG